MSGLIPLTFGAPWILVALLGLPAIWWLLRVTPPAPTRLRFPAIRLILGVETPEESPAHTPWWILMLRLFIAGLVILGLAGPFWNAAQQDDASGPRVIVVDNTWAAASDWDIRVRTIRELIDEAGRADRPVAIIATAPTLGRSSPVLQRATEARDVASALTPTPYLADHTGALAQADELALLVPSSGAEIIWISDGMESEGRIVFADRLSELGELEIHSAKDDLARLALSPPIAERNGFYVPIRRAITATNGAPQAGHLRAVGRAGRTLARVPFTFGAGANDTSALIELPLDLRNEATRIEIEGARSAGETVLIDEGAKRRSVGLVSGVSAYDDQPLLSEAFYLHRALEPYAELREGAIGELIDGGVSALILTDVGRLSGEDYAMVRDWTEAGGLLIRFAGPRLAAQNDDLLPVTLRIGDRRLGGSLAWDVPQGLLPFDDQSPFAGLDISEEVAISHQVLAEPEIELAEKTWARLADGTPLVTGARRGEGWAVLFHVTANQDWSSLPSSGLYVEMLRRLMRLSAGIADAGAAGEGQTLLPPIAILDGYGRLQTPPATAEPITASGLRSAAPNPRNPPGLYGSDDAAHALNPVPSEQPFDAAGDWPLEAQLFTFRTASGVDFKPLILSTALALFLVDIVLSLFFAGLLPVRRFARGTAALAVLTIGLSAASQTNAQEAQLSEQDRWAIIAATELHLAYVITGDTVSDDLARAGLAGLTRTLFARTTVEPAEPIGVDLESSELAFFPLLYWRVSPQQRALTIEAVERLQDYMRNGGTVLVDTADADSVGALGGPSSGTDALRRLITDLDVPPLAPVPQNHVLTRAFYLINTFPGRFAGGDLWVEAPGENGLGSVDRDGVSPILIGANDYAAAWATDDAGRPLATVTPGGADQREMANRFGVNLVMYTLTGNYKSDQVHVPALLERLGQ